MGTNELLGMYDELVEGGEGGGGITLQVSKSKEK